MPWQKAMFLLQLLVHFGYVAQINKNDTAVQPLHLSVCSCRLIPNKMHHIMKKKKIALVSYKQKEDQLERKVFMLRCAQKVCPVLVLLATRQNNFTHDEKPTRLRQNSSDVH